MNLVHVAVVLVVIGFVLYLLNEYVPMQPAVKAAVNVVIVIVLILWLLDLFGLGYIPLRK